MDFLLSVQLHSTIDQYYIKFYFCINIYRDGDGMEEFYKNSNYRSAWRPLTRENDLSIISTSSGVETLKKNNESVGTPTEVNKTPEQNEILKKLAEISADINTLNHIVLDQSEKINNLLSLFEGKEAAGKKNVFGLQRK